MSTRLTRREMMSASLAGVATMSSVGGWAMGEEKKFGKPEGFKGDIKQSVSKWCFGSVPLDEFCEICKGMGMVGVDLINPSDWELVGKHGLTVTMGNVPEVGITVGINRTENHDRIVKRHILGCKRQTEAVLTEQFYIHNAFQFNNLTICSR